MRFADIEDNQRYMVSGIVIKPDIQRRYFRKMLRSNSLFEWRMGRDSNPRYLAVHTLSRRAQSTALAPIRGGLGTFLLPNGSFNWFSPSVCDPDNRNPCKRVRLCLFERLNERLKFCLELALPLLNDFQLQLVAMQLDRRVMNVALNFGQLRLALAKRTLQLVLAPI
jgi:hypothetical protein